MADLARPMLAEVLAALTGTSAGEWACDRRSFRIATSGASINMRPTVPWTTTDPAEAQETLVARGLLPEGWCDVAQRGWWCARCAKRCDRHTKTVPSTIPDLVAVASLGWPAIHRAETLARDACAALREYGCPQPERVVWRVGERARADALLWRDSIHNRVQVSARGVVPVHGRLDVRPERRVVAGIEALWLSGLALDAIDREAVRIVVPPVGGSRG